MMHVILDGNEMSNRDEIHMYLKSKLNITGYHGNNLDSLWDALSSSSQPLTIEMIHPEKMQENLGAYGNSIISVFNDAAQENSHVDFTIKKHEKS